MYKIKKEFLITIATVMISITMQFFYIRYISYEVDTVVYGNFILLQSLIAGLSYFFLQVPSQAYSRFFNSSKNKTRFINEFRSILILINFISLIIILIFGYFISKFSIAVLFFTFVYFFLINNYSFGINIFLLNLDRSKYFYLKILEAISKFLFPIALYSIYETLLSLIVGLCLGFGFSFFVMLFFTREYKFYLIFNLDNLYKYLKFSYPMLFVSMFAWSISFSDRYFIEYLASTKEVGVYSILAQVAGFGQVLGQVYAMYVNPMVLRKFESNTKDALNLLSDYLKILLLIFCIALVLIYIIPTSMFEILISPSVIHNSNNYTTFLVLTLAVFVAVFQTSYSLYLNLFKKLDVLAYIYIPALIVNIIGNLFVGKHGIIAAAISTLMAYLVILLGQVIYVKRKRKSYES